MSKLVVCFAIVVILLNVFSIIEGQVVHLNCVNGTVQIDCDKICVGPFGTYANCNYKIM